MNKFVHNPKDFWSGVMFLLFAAGAVVIGQDYSMGTAGRMGPAYFPTVLGGLLGVIGLVTMLRGLFTRGEAMERFSYRNALLVLVAVVLFGFLVRGAGMVPAVIALVLVSAVASARFRIKAALPLSIGAALFCLLVFVKGLGLPIPAFGPWFGQ